MYCITSLLGNELIELSFNENSLFNIKKTNIYYLIRVDDSFYMLTKILHPSLGVRHNLSKISSIGSIVNEDKFIKDILSVEYCVKGEFENGFSFKYGKLIMLTKRELEEEDISILSAYEIEHKPLQSESEVLSNNKLEEVSGHA